MGTLYFLSAHLHTELKNPYIGHNQDALWDMRLLSIDAIMQVVQVFK